MCGCTGHFGLAEVTNVFTNTNAHSRTPFERPPNGPVEIAEKNVPRCKPEVSFSTRTPAHSSSFRHVTRTVIRKDRIDPDWIQFSYCEDGDGNSITLFFPSLMDYLRPIVQHTDEISLISPLSCSPL